MAGQLKTNPLSQADYARINKQLAQLDLIRQEVQRAYEAGFPCAEEDQACQNAIKQLQNIKRVYFPEQP